MKDLAPTVLEFVRPTRIEAFAVTGVTVEPTLLHEGDGVRVMTLGSSAPSRVVLTGKLWSDPIRTEIAITDKFSRQTAAFVFGSDEHQSLSHDEQLRVAMMGRAVSPVTSYVAFEPRHPTLDDRARGYHRPRWVRGRRLRQRRWRRWPRCPRDSTEARDARRRRRLRDVGAVEPTVERRVHC